jgi:hypothetical protein
MEPNERDDMVISLVLEAGRLMEDLSPELALVLPIEEESRRAKLGAMLEASTAATTLLQAAIVIGGIEAP